MDAKDLRTESALSDRNNDGSKYSQSGGLTLHCDRNKSYQDIGSNSSAKVDVPNVRPCAVIGPDRVVPPTPPNEAYLKKASAEPWPCMDNPYHSRRPPEYPHKMANYQNPSRNISPRQTFQENMQRIMVPPSYNSVKISDDTNYAQMSDRNNVLPKNVKINVPPEAKFCDVPYTVYPTSNEQKNVRNSEMCISSVNPSLTRTAPHGWPLGNVNIRPTRTYGAPEVYQYQDYPSCAGPRPVVPRPNRNIPEEGYVYADPFYHQEGNIRYKPYPTAKERFPQQRYEYVGNYANSFNPPPAFPSHKYELQKQLPPHPYPPYPPIKYLDRVSEQTMEGYQRNQQGSYNIPFRNQIIHPNYGPVIGNPQNKIHSYPSDGHIKSVAPNKISYDNTKAYIEYENGRPKMYPPSESYIVNEMGRMHPMKSQVIMPNYPALNVHNIPPNTYYKKDNQQMKNYEYIQAHFRGMDPNLNFHNPAMVRHAPVFSPNTLAISPTDSSASNDTLQTLGTSQEDCGYVSQSSTASVRSIDSGVNRIPNEYLRKYYDSRFGPVFRTSPVMSKSDSNSNNNSKEKKNIDVRQFLSMWNEGDEEIEENNSKEVIIKSGPKCDNSFSKAHEMITQQNQEQLYVLGLVNVPSEELAKYEHIQKVSKLPENIKGYNHIELLNQFEEAIESSNMANYKAPTAKDFQIPTKGVHPKQPTNVLPPRPLSPLDVEAKISQSVIHKEVGCNFEIKPCSPKMLNVEVATPVQNILSERVIEKVANPVMLKSPRLNSIEENIECNIMKRQDHRLNINNDPVGISSCKMIKTPFSSNNSMDSIKSGYSLQDLESNAGLCLASLPRLDNDIELNFPEVNQQFINANKGDASVSNSHADLPALGVLDHSDSQNKNKPNDINTFDESEFTKSPCLADSEKEFSKLSKYRKTRTLTPDPKENLNAVRTDSVIIKNPENLKNYENKSSLLSNSINQQTSDVQQVPINLTSQNNITNGVDNVVPNAKADICTEKQSSEIAIDFSLNKSSAHYENECSVETSVVPVPSIQDVTGTNYTVIEESLTKLPNLSDCDEPIQDLLTNNDKIDENSVPTESNHLKNDINSSTKIDVSTGIKDINSLDVIFTDQECLSARTTDKPANEHKSLTEPFAKEIDNTGSNSVMPIEFDEHAAELLDDDNKDSCNKFIDIHRNKDLLDKKIHESDFIDNNLSQLNKDEEGANVAEVHISKETTDFDVKVKTPEGKSLDQISNSSEADDSRNKDLDKDISQQLAGHYTDFDVFSPRENITASPNNDMPKISDQDNGRAFNASLLNVVSPSVKDDLSETDKLDIDALDVSNNAVNVSTTICKTDTNDEENNISLPSPTNLKTLSIEDHLTENTKQDIDELDYSKKVTSPQNCKPEINKEVTDAHSEFNCSNNLKTNDLEANNPDSYHSNHFVDKAKSGKMTLENTQQVTNVDFGVPVPDNNIFTRNLDHLTDDADIEISNIDDPKVMYVPSPSDCQLETSKQKTDSILDLPSSTYVMSDSPDDLSDITECENNNLVSSCKNNNNFNLLYSPLIHTDDINNTINLFDGTPDHHSPSSADVEKIPEVSLLNIASPTLHIESEKNESSLQEPIITLNKKEMPKADEEKRYLCSIRYLSYGSKEMYSSRIQNLIMFREGNVKKIIDPEIEVSKETEVSCDLEQCLNAISDDGIEIPCTKLENCDNYKLALTPSKAVFSEVNENDENIVKHKENKSKSVKLNNTNNHSDPCKQKDESEKNETPESSTVLTNVTKVASSESYCDKQESQSNFKEEMCCFSPKEYERWEKPYFSDNNDNRLLGDEKNNKTRKRALSTHSTQEQLDDEFDTSNTVKKDKPSYICDLMLAQLDKKPTHSSEDNLNCESNDNISLNLDSRSHCSENIEDQLEKQSDSKNVEQYETQLNCDITHEDKDKRSNCSSKNSERCDGQLSCNDEMLEFFDKQSNCSDEITNKLDTKTNCGDEKPEEYDKEFESSCSYENPELWDKLSNSNNEIPEQWDRQSNCDEEGMTAVVDNDEIVNTPSQTLESNLHNTKRQHLKRSLSDSALNMYNNNKQILETEENVSFVWPFKRRKINNVENDVLAQNLCNIIQSNRRNSISSFYNEENVSFCILIDNSCIIEENDEQEKICYTELPAECLREIQNECTKQDEITEMIPNDSLHQENECSFSNSYVMDGEDEKLEDSWVEDVACVETVISDDIEEDIEISGPSNFKDDVLSDNDESGVFSSSEHTDKVKYIYGDKMCNDDAQLVETLYNTPQMDVNKTLGQRESLNLAKCYDKDSLERILSEPNVQEFSPYGSEYTEPVFSPGIAEAKENINNKENMDAESIFTAENKVNGMEEKLEHEKKFKKLSHETHDDTVHSCESSVDNVFSYKENDENTNYITSSSPEVSSTTSEEKNSAILLKITNYKGSRISQINDVHRDMKRPSCKFTEEKAYVQSHSHFSAHRPLLTKAAQKYIPPLKESIRDLKVQLLLPQHSLIKLKELKKSKDEPKVSKQNISVPRGSKKPKPKFEDVLKSIDEIQFKMHKEKTKKTKKSIPKVVIKKSENGSHYASTSSKNEFNPDLTGRKWQPWVFLEKNHFIDKMAIKKKTRAIYSHRKRTYVLAEKFQKYKSVNSAKFVISPPISDCPSTGLKYTIRLKHNY